MNLADIDSLLDAVEDKQNITLYGRQASGRFRDGRHGRRMITLH